MSFGVTTAGFVTKRLADIKEEMEAAYRATFGAGVNLASTSPFGQIIGIHAEREAEMWEIAEAVYFSQYPDTASGVPLDNAVALTGIARKGKSASFVNAIFSGDDGLVIPAGFVVSVVGNPAARFALAAEITIASGTATGLMVALTDGALQAPEGSLSDIETPLSGLESVTNDDAATVGLEIETDAALKLRQAQSLRRAGGATVEAIRADILELAGVSACDVLENITLVTDENGLPGKSFEAVVLGGDDQEIADSIWSNKPAGIQSYGDVTKQVTDSEGFDHDVSFSRPSQLDIWIELDLTTTIEYPANGDTLVGLAILAYGATLGSGDDIIVMPKLISYLGQIAGIADVEIRIGTAINPTLDDNIVVSPLQIAVFDAARIEVNS